MRSQKKKNQKTFEAEIHWHEQKIEICALLLSS